MHLIGYWLASLKDLQFCHPLEVVGDLAPEVRKRLADYLDAGGLAGIDYIDITNGVSTAADKIKQELADWL